MIGCQVINAKTSWDFWFLIYPGGNLKGTNDTLSKFNWVFFQELSFFLSYAGSLYEGSGSRRKASANLHCPQNGGWPSSPVPLAFQLCPSLPVSQNPQGFFYWTSLGSKTLQMISRGVRKGTLAQLGGGLLGSASAPRSLLMTLSKALQFLCGALLSKWAQ